MTYLLLFVSCSPDGTHDTASAADSGAAPPSEVPDDPAYPYGGCVGTERYESTSANSAEYVTTYDAVGRAVSRTTGLTDGSVQRTYSWTYEGECLVEETDDGAVIVRTAYGCDDQGKPIMATAYDTDSAQWDMLYTYRADARLDRMDYDFDRDGTVEAFNTWTWLVDAEGSTAEVHNTYDGETVFRERYTYDADDRLVLLQQEDNGDGTYAYTYGYAYGESGTLVSWWIEKFTLTHSLVEYAPSMDDWGRIAATDITSTTDDGTKFFHSTTTYACP